MGFVILTLTLQIIMGRPKRKYELKMDPGVCLDVTDLANILEISESAAAQRLLNHGIDTAYAMPVNQPVPCACGCRRIVRRGKYHSAACRNKHYREMRDNGELDVFDTMTCTVCGTVFNRYLTIDGREPVTTCCSRRCQSKASWATRQEKAKTKLVTRQCCYSLCNKTFDVPYYSNQKYCCTDHKVLETAYKQAKGDTAKLKKLRKQREQKEKSKNKVTESSRGEFCIRKIDGYQITCKFYDNWITNGNCNCDNGFTPEK